MSRKKTDRRWRWVPSCAVCGISGWIDFNAATSSLELEGTVGAMTGALAHRGPDDEGLWSDPAAGACLGHSRLAIIDPTRDGHEPMLSGDGRYVLVFNGEIYNHAQLRVLLTHQGVRFAGGCDAETLLEAISAWGVKVAIERTDGMFAFAVYDRDRRGLILARDRLGEKPLYYGWLGQSFVFASELKALRLHPAFRGEIDQDALGQYLRYGYVPAPRSIYKNIQKLPPGTIVEVGPTSSASASSPTAYWTLRETAIAGLASPIEASETEAVDELERLLRETISSRMMSDVPLGAFLSGGIDSSLVVALMQEIADKPVRTFTIGVEEPGFDETNHAALVASHLGTDHRQLVVTPARAREIIPELPWIYDEPFADSSQLPTVLVSALAGSHVKVALSGDGGDEIFGGYVRYAFGDKMWGRLSRIPYPLRATAASALRSVDARRWDRVIGGGSRLLPERMRWNRPGEKLYKLADVLELESPSSVFERLVSIWSRPEHLPQGFVSSDATATGLDDLDGRGDFVDWMMYTDAMTYLPDDILTKVDRASMSRSLEVRVPYLAPQVVEFAWRLPRAMKIHQGAGKWLLRRVLYRHVPREIIDRPKQGFGVPIGEWLRGPLRDWAGDLLSDDHLRNGGLIDPEPVRAAWHEHLDGVANHEHRLWSVLMLQSWKNSH